MTAACFTLKPSNSMYTKAGIYGKLNFSFSCEHRDGILVANCSL